MGALISSSRVDQTIAVHVRFVRAGMGRGKSGLHRTRRQVTPGGREPTESAAENIPPDIGLPGTGKGEMVR